MSIGTLYDGPTVVRRSELAALAVVALTWAVADPVLTLVGIWTGDLVEVNPVMLAAMDRWGLVTGVVVMNVVAFVLLSVLCIAHWRALDAVERAADVPRSVAVVARYAIPAAVTLNAAVLCVGHLAGLVG